MKSILFVTFAIFSFSIGTTSASSFFLRSNEVHIDLPKGTNEKEKGIDFGNTESVISEKEFSVLYWGRDNFRCPSQHGAFPDPKDCSSFYVCSHGRSSHKRCNRNMLFDVHRRVCLPRWIAVCGDGKDQYTRQPRTTPRTRVTGNDKDFKCNDLYGTYPHPTQCEKYYTCILFTASLKTCPEKQLFDAIKKKCLAEREVNCGSRQRPFVLRTTENIVSQSEEITTKVTEIFSTSELITEKTESTEPSTEELTSPVPESSPTLEQRTESTAEESTTSKPTGPPETDCGEDDVDCIIKETGEVSDWFTCPEAMGSYEHASSNKLFIFCLNWKPSVKRCGQDLVFSIELATCIRPE